MKKFLSIFAVFAAYSLSSAGAILTLQPSSGSIIQGSNLSVDVVVSGLTTGTAPALGAFQLDFTFDSALLTFVGVSFGNQLSLNATPSIQGFIPGVGSAVTVYESSFNNTAQLESGQADTFLLFRINFTSIATGTSGLQLANLVMGDASAIPNDITNSFSVVGSSVTITGAGAEIPEPGVTSLMTAGAGFLAALHYRRRLRQ